VINRLANQTRITLFELARQAAHDALLAWHCPDPIDDRMLKLELDLGDCTASLKLLVVTLRRHGRVLAFSPSLPELWYDVESSRSLEQRAQAVYQSYFRQQRKTDPDYSVDRHSIAGKAWIDRLTVDVVPQREAKPPADPLRAWLGGEDVSDGAAQLRQVGRCLSWLDRNDLAEPIGVDADVRRLLQLLQVGDRRGVMLVGPPGSGKTARIEGAVRWRGRAKRAAAHGLVWHLSPPRLISGMSYLGQWQDRVLAILRHAHQYDQILYFDDLLGLYDAGKTRDSSLCVADTLRAQLDVLPIRLLAEMSHEAWAILRERDRSMADRFVVLPTAALDVEASLPVLIGVRSRLEAQHGCRFDLDVLPEVVSLYDRFERAAVLPGKAAAALSRLAARSRHRAVTREDAITEFQSRSGLRPSIIDRRAKIDRQRITSRIGEQVVGQDESVARLVDRVLIAAARLNDTSRPLGTFLLVGPTGVGKTQLAKAIADSLFDDGGLIRLDMNELSSPTSAARLVGTFDAPDGLLTSAVRRRPHAVLLLDEIEKAHPAVLDVLLQAIGEARLSDARGRTVDLSGLLILMTSNLGSRQSGRSSGFADAEQSQAVAGAHDRAVREFFRPEFFNRIDAVLSFERLSAETLQSIAWMQLQTILRRDGLQRRSVLIDVEPAAIEQTAMRGHDPAMGARALKRQIERDLVRPAAEILAASSTDSAALLRLFLDDGQLCTRWQTVTFAARGAEPRQTGLDELCGLASRFLDQAAAQIDASPLRFQLSGRAVDPSLLETMTLRDSLYQCRDELRGLLSARDQPRLQRPQATPVQAVTQARLEPSPRALLRDMQAVADIQDYLRESLVGLAAGQLEAQRDQLIDALSRLRGQLEARGTAMRWLVWTRWYGHRSPLPAAPVALDGRGKQPGGVTCEGVLATAIERWIVAVEGLLSEPAGLPGDAPLRCFSGALARSTLSELCGGWMFVQPSGELSLAEVRIHAVDETLSCREQAARWQQQEGRASVEPVRRILRGDGPQVDLVSGTAVNAALSVESIVQLLSLSRRNIEFLWPHREPSR
jgi:ATP-dependent Clp protease ATP-binding subunit ClpA